MMSEQLASGAPRAVVGVLVCLLLTLLAAAPAGAAPAWIAPVALSAGELSYGARVDVDGLGNAVAAWTHFDGAVTVVRGAVRPAGGHWQPPVDLSPPGISASQAQVAVDAHGNAIVVWTHYGTDGVVQAAVHPVDGVWQAAVDLSARGGSVSEPQVRADARGNAAAFWSRGVGGGSVVQSAVRRAGGGWQAPVDLLSGSSVSDLDVAVGAQGDVVAVWQSYDATGSHLQSAGGPLGEAWHPADISSAGLTTFWPQVAVDARGGAVAVWHRYDDSSGDAIVQSAVRPAGGDWQAAVDISTGSQYTQPAQVGVDEQGNAVAIWGHSKGVQSAVRVAGGDWQAEVDLGAPGEPQEPQLDVDAQGNAVAIWYRGTGTNHLYLVQSAVRLAGAGWQAPFDLATVEEVASPQVAAGRHGNAVAVWQNQDTGNRRIQSSAYDPAGPLLGGLTVPQSGVVGEPLAFSVSPFDVWSALGATSWAFGDGEGASGTAVTHTYATAGTFSVGVTAADALANRSSATRTVTIAPAPAPEPAPAPRRPGAAPVPPRPATSPLPAVAGLRLSQRTFRAARSGPAVRTMASRTGTRVRYTLSMAADVRFTVQRCVTTKSNRCTRFVRVPGSFQRRRPAGTDRFTFTARLGPRALKPGRYRLVATPASNGRGGTAAHARFRVVR